MDFFDRQDQARKRTRVLLFLFAAVVLLVFTLNYFVLAALLGPFFRVLPHAQQRMPFFESIFWLVGEAFLRPGAFCRWLWDPQLFCWIFAGTLLSIAGGCAYKTRMLAAGGRAVAELLEGRRIEPATGDPDEQQLRHVVEEMALASGMPVPEIYVLDSERGINAFAAGHTREDAAVVVTRGALKLLNRDQLQGVIAHEFSHVLHGDTRLNMQLMALAHGLFWPTYLGRLLIYGSTDARPPADSVLDEETAQRLLPTAPLGLLLLILGSTSLPFVRLLKCAICRQREWLADASAVQFTRNPGGLAGALKKIGGLYKQGRLDTPLAEVASHLYLVNYTFDSWFTALAIHPPLAARVRAIDPAFDGTFEKVLPLKPSRQENERNYDNVLAGIMLSERLSPGQMAAGAGDVTVAKLQRAALVRLGLPPEITCRLRTPEGGISILYALLLSGEESIRSEQLALLRAALDETTFNQTAEVAGQIASLPPDHRLPLAELAVPTARFASPSAAARFCEVMQQLIEHDAAVDLFEYTLMKMVQRRLQPDASKRPAQTWSFTRPSAVVNESCLLLSALAHVGHESEEQARIAFQSGAEFLDPPGLHPAFVPRTEWDLYKIDAALERLSLCSPSARRNILVACGKTVAADGKIQSREAELLRAIADALDCPMPPFVEALRSDELAAGR